jgi:hypothetical protein
MELQLSNLGQELLSFQTSNLSSLNSDLPKNKSKDLLIKKKIL